MEVVYFRERSRYSGKDLIGVYVKREGKVYFGWIAFGDDTHATRAFDRRKLNELSGEKDLSKRLARNKRTATSKCKALKGLNIKHPPFTDPVWKWS